MSKVNILSSQSSNSMEEPQYTILKPCEVLDLLQKEVCKVHSVVGNVSKIKLRSLLNKYKWDVDVFLEKFYDNRIAELKIDESEEFSEETSQDSAASPPADVSENRKRHSTKAQPAEPVRKSRRLLVLQDVNLLIPLQTEETMKTCEICFDEKPFKDLQIMQCHHIFCTGCFKQYLETIVESTDNIGSVQCPGFKCDQLVEDTTAMNVLDAAEKIKYQHRITNGFVQSSRLLKWCSQAGCSNAIKKEKVGGFAVRCDCGYLFCFKCSEEIHDMIPCEMVKDFKVVKERNFQTASWLVKNTKPCPKCNVDIEKNGGCNHMHCSLCNIDFCWLCLKDWNQHRGCTAAAAEAFKTGNMKRLVDCSTKNSTMIQSIKLDEIMYKTRLSEQEMGIDDDWMKIDFVKEAIDVLLRCRRTLADSFIFAYFATDEANNQWIRFKCNQTELIAAVENLSHTLEMNVDHDNYHSLKMDIKNKRVLCSGLHRALFEHVKDGFELDWWKVQI